MGRAFFSLEEANDVLEKIKQKHAYKQTPEYIQEEDDKRQTLLAKKRVRSRIVEQAKSTEEKIANQTRQKERRLQNKNNEKTKTKTKHVEVVVPAVLPLPLPSLPPLETAIATTHTTA